jgi:hypothetical protein
VLEAERDVPRVELTCSLVEADNLTILVGIRRHPVPGFRREDRRVGFNDRVEALGHGAFRFRHLGDLREHCICHLLVSGDDLLHLEDGLLICYDVATVCVTRWWEGVDSTWEQEALYSKRGRIPPVRHTLCQAVPFTAHALALRAIDPLSSMGNESRSFSSSFCLFI